MHIQTSVFNICTYFMLILPIADPSLRVTSTVTSSDAALFSVIVPISESLLSATKYCDWFSDTTASVG